MKSPAQLGELHKSGQKVQKRVQIAIDKELERVCGFKKCDVSLAFRRTDAKFCKPSHSTSEVSRIRTENRRKKARYNKRHGLERKTIKRNVTPTIAALPATTPVVYEDYKEPLKLIEKGFGYYGTLALSEDRNYVQCHICGQLFSALSYHIPRHKLSVKSYKEQFGLGIRTALIGEATRQRMQHSAVKKFDGKLPEHLKDFNRLRHEGKIPVKGSKPSLEWRNKRGLCPDQVLEKIKELADKLGRTPSQDEFRAEYKGRFEGSITYQHGSYLNAVAKLGMKSAKELKEHTSEQLLENLREFADKYGHIPMTSDFNRGLLGAARGTYIARFGSLNNARIEAGLNAVIPMPFGQILELDPQQYAEYQAGHGLTKDAVKARKRRFMRRKQIV